MSPHALDFPPVSYPDYEPERNAPTPTVVVGYEGSAASCAAVRLAAGLAGRSGRVVAVQAQSGAVVIGSCGHEPSNTLSSLLRAGISPALALAPDADDGTGH